MYIFYNNKFDLRIVIMEKDFHLAIEKLRKYLYETLTSPYNKLDVDEFEYEVINKIIE